ncbi:MAG: nidogen-like domain-containing protein, partial [Chloroflexota bacterium]
MGTLSKINQILSFFIILALLGTSLVVPIQRAEAAELFSPIRNLSGFGTNSLAANDDSSTGVIPIGFTINFFNKEHSTLYVNNNGNITFDAPQYIYTPYDLTSTTREIIAAFFSDVDTRNIGSSLVTFGNDTINGHQAFGVNYFNVGYYKSHSDKLNSFQLILIDRSDVGSGDFDIEFNYDKIQWETGDASEGAAGLGGHSARVGFSNGSSTLGTFFELPGSANNSTFLDSNLVTGLKYNSFNNNVLGRFQFQTRNGTINIDHNPLILIPGIAGSRMENDPNLDGIYDEVWPNTNGLIISGDDDFLRALKLNSSGKGPYTSENKYKTMRVGDMLRSVPVPLNPDMDYYFSTVKFFTEQRHYEEYGDNPNFFVCPYDWRKHIPDIANGALNNTLDKCIAEALLKNPGKTKVDILAHSMGGLIARYYVSNPSRASKVEHLVTLGTPYLGAPKIAQATIDKMCFVEKEISVATEIVTVCFSNVDTLKEIAQNFPSIYEIAPGKDFFKVYKGYIFRDWDKNGDGVTDGWLDYSASYAMLAARNATLAANAQNMYYGSVGGWANGGTNGVKVLMIVGSGLPTLTRLWESQEPDWWNPSNKRIVYKIYPGTGDGTVPLNSANMRNPYTGVNLSANVPTVYYKLKHEELPIKTEVLQVVASFFENSQNLVNNANRLSSMQKNGLCTSNKDAGQEPCVSDLAVGSQTSNSPGLDPFPLNGQFLTFKGAATLEVIDQYGNRIGLLGSDNTYEVNVPGAGFYPLDNAFSVFLPNDRTYQILVDGQTRTQGLVTIQQYVNDNVESTTVYNPLLLGENSSASLSFDPNSPAGSFAIDENGDSITDSQADVAIVLNGEQSMDTTAPLTTIRVDGTRSLNGWYTGTVTVTITAVDNPGGVGVNNVEYSFDSGQTIHDYTGPFTMDANTHYQIMARSIDFAGNSSWQSVLPLYSQISDAAKDGWVLESTEKSNQGRTLNSTTTTFRLGDDATKKQYRSILSFGTASLPDNAVITKVTLNVKKQSVTGRDNPVTMFQGFLVDVKKGSFGTSAALQTSDFQTVACKTLGPFTPTIANNWYSFDISTAKDCINQLGASGGITQMRLRFKLD